MLEKGIIYAFKLMAITIISVLLWAFFMGKPTNADKTTTTQTYATQGSKFEEIVYGSASGGFHGVSLDNYLRNTGNSGFSLWFMDTAQGSYNAIFSVTGFPTSVVKPDKASVSGDGGFITI